MANRIRKNILFTEEAYDIASKKSEKHHAGNMSAYIRSLIINDNKKKKR